MSKNSRSSSPEESTSEDHVLLWNEDRVREDVKQTYPLRLPEPLHLKLKFLAEKTGKSMIELCNEAVRSLVDEQLREVLELDG